MAAQFYWGSGRKTDEQTKPRRSLYTVTNALIAINALVFVAMLTQGVSFMEPSAREVIPWGADFGPLTVGEGQWWRLLSACFVHFGVIHIAMNMYVLYQIGLFIEQIFGRIRYLLIYLFAGLAGSVVSLLTHPLTTSAGASGAIFGLYGAVFGFLLIERRSLVPGAFNSVGRSAGIFIVYNFIYGGMSRRIDLSAHLGGLIAGFIAGLLLVRPRAGGSWRLPSTASVSLLLAVLGTGVYALEQRPENHSAANGLIATIMTSPTVLFGSEGKLFYSGSVTEEEARALAGALADTELGKTTGAMVIFSKQNGRTTVSVPLDGDEQAELWNNADVVEDFTALGQQLAPAVGGKPFNMVLLDQNGTARRAIAVPGK